jgi:arsenate reductase (glutaredoxin)
MSANERPAMMDTTLFGIPNCDTVKRARAWLAERGVAHRFHDFKKAGVPPASLDGWLATLGWQRLLNTRGTTWRQLDEATRAAVVDAASARALMLAHPSVIKRPVVAWADGSTTVGFDEAEFSRRLAGHPGP